MQDVEVPARVDIAGGRSARPAGLAGAREYRLILVVASFLAAVLLGVGIGYVTADRGSSAATATGGTTPAPELTPAMSPASWDTNRHPGTAHQMNVMAEPDPAALRLALSWTVADQIKAGDAASTVTASQVTVERGTLYFGAVEGVDAAHDAYWAVGRTQVDGVAQPPANPHVWQRISTGPWTIVANGPNACAKLPTALIGLWKGPPPPCVG